MRTREEVEGKGIGTNGSQTQEYRTEFKLNVMPHVATLEEIPRLTFPATLGLTWI
jgi:hypothetical protein